MTSKSMMLATGFVWAATCHASQPPEDRSLQDLDRRYAAIRDKNQAYEAGGAVVLETAYRTLREGKAQGKWPVVGLEDLWVEAIQEGRTLFNDPARRWGKTTAAETKDMIGQTTIGPWQITVTNVRTKYGLPYGVSPDWADADVYAFCRDRPEVQVKMIADYIQEAYTNYGRRGPYGIQRYFWLEAYVRGWIGQGKWDQSVLPSPPDGDWKKLTPEMKADTGFYAKQILLGWRGNSRGLLYWLWVTGDVEGIRDTLRTWRDQKRMAWDEAASDAVLTQEPGNYAISPEDLAYLKKHPECHQAVTRLVAEVLAEKRQDRHPMAKRRSAMEIQSPSFRPNEPIPKRFTGDGEDISPQLTWTGMPQDARELALICDDPDAPRPEPWVHWVIYKIPAQATGLPENVAKTETLDEPAGLLQGRNSWRRIGYGGPAPPPGHGVHHYHFKLYALDTVLSTGPGMDKDQLLAAMKGHILAECELVGTYER